MDKDGMGFLETVVTQLRAAREDLIESEEREAKMAEFNRMLAIVDAQCVDARRRVREEGTARNIRLGLPADYGLTYDYDDDRR